LSSSRRVKTLFAQDYEWCIRALLQEVSVRLTIRNCRVLMTVPRLDDRGPGMSTAHFFFLLYLGTLELVEGTRGILCLK
jgi:hypothetical protein